ncbi:MAG: hypothetical protein KDM81_14175 [Verrucomicrobiae bacterium]|nr:hypothetical protein [Verrucomicrobiae bacterium]MCP5524696.1 hypothetical protein [Verrucomicrobiales bacterium]
MIEELDHVGRDFSGRHRGGEETGAWLLTEGAQPAMVKAMGARLFAQYDATPRQARPKRERITSMLLVLRAFVEVLDRKCRQDD